MDWIMTQETREKEDRLLNAWWIARDGGDAWGDCGTRLDILDYYTGAGCPSPDAALLAALLINPAGLAEARDVITAEMLPRHHDAQLYQAMLCTPETNGLAQWWQMLARVSGLKLWQVTCYLTYDYSNAGNVALYAAVIRQTFLYEQALRIVEQMIGALYNAGNGIGAAIESLQALHEGAPTYMRPPRRWSAAWRTP